jgi:hypothetical protein
LLRRAFAVAAASAALVIAPATAAYATSGALPSTNTSHRCVAHTTGLCGWTHRQKPANKWETAQCKDYSLSYSAHSSGTCSYHHGVRYWFK